MVSRSVKGSDSMAKSYIGGQAVLEGVMMRGKNYWVVAVRRPDQEIVLQSDRINSLAERIPIFKKPILRGISTLVEALTMGIKALNFSAKHALGEEEEEIGGREIALMIVMGIVLALVLIIVLPAFFARFLDNVVSNTVLFNVIEGFIRIGIFIGYIVIISRLKDISRLFQYHGAEHKVIHAYETEGALSAEVAAKYSPLHVRCGTAFLLVVMVVLILIFAFLGRPTLWLRIGSRLLLIPLIAGVSYEIIRLAGKFERSPLVRLAMAPGLWLQKLTTREPSESQLEVALVSLQKLLELEGIKSKDEIESNMA